MDDDKLGSKRRMFSGSGGIRLRATRTRAARQRRKENVADLSPAVKLLNFLSLDGRGMR
jgi:hypothetical protein